MENVLSACTKSQQLTYLRSGTMLSSMCSFKDDKFDHGNDYKDQGKDKKLDTSKVNVHLIYISTR